jgi:hypothetical protein
MVYILVCNYHLIARSASVQNMNGTGNRSPHVRTYVSEPSQGRDVVNPRVHMSAITGIFESRLHATRLVFYTS